MTTTAATWFYREPEPIAYYLEERVNQTLWQARFGDVWLDTVSAVSPYRMAGKWREMPVEIEWRPNDSFVLRVPQGSDPAQLVDGISRVLALRPALSYTDADEHFVTEWYVDGGAGRWQAIQGKAGFANPRRFRG